MARTLLSDDYIGLYEAHALARAGEQNTQKRRQNCPLEDGMEVVKGRSIGGPITKTMSGEVMGNGNE